MSTSNFPTRMVGYQQNKVQDCISSLLENHDRVFINGYRNDGADSMMRELVIQCLNNEDQYKIFVSTIMERAFMSYVVTHLECGYNRPCYNMVATHHGSHLRTGRSSSGLRGLSVDVLICLDCYVIKNMKQMLDLLLQSPFVSKKVIYYYCGKINKQCVDYIEKLGYKYAEFNAFQYGDMEDIKKYYLNMYGNDVDMFKTEFLNGNEFFVGENENIYQSGLLFDVKNLFIK